MKIYRKNTQTWHVLKVYIILPFLCAVAQDLLLRHCDVSELGSKILVHHGKPHLGYCLLDDVPCLLGKL